MKKLKYTIIAIFAFLFLSLKIGDSKSEYQIPISAISVISNDLDLEGDADIVFGHNYSSISNWSGITFFENIENGIFEIKDTLYMYGGQNIIYSFNIIGNEYPEILGRFYDGQQTNVAIIEINNGNYYISYFPMCNHLTDFIYGDISGNDAIDFAFISNNDFLWGIIYNDGTGNFTAPEYFDLTFPPIDIACADLNDDGRADVVISGSDTEIYFSNDTGFQQLVLTTTLSHDVSISDFDNDGDNDIITHTTFVYPNHRVYMFENNGNNQFLEHDYFQFSPFCAYGQISDFNNDSLPDMIFIDWDHSELLIYNNLGDFQLEYDQNIDINNLGYQLGSLDCNDFDGNGFNDIVTIISTQMTLPYNVIILFNDGEGNFVPDPITNVPEKSESLSDIKAFPNPFTEKINFNFSKIQCSKLNISIYDLRGKNVFSLTTNFKKGGKNLLSWNACDFNNNEVKPGIYFAVVQTDGIFFKSIKLIKH